MESLTFINRITSKEDGTTQVDSTKYQQRYTKKSKLCVAVLVIVLILCLGLSAVSLISSLNNNERINLMSYQQNSTAEELRNHLVDALEMGEIVNNQTNITQELLDSQQEQQRNFESVRSYLNSQIDNLKQQARQLVSQLLAVRALVTANHAGKSK